VAVVGTGEGAGGVHDSTNEVGAAVGGGISAGISGGSHQASAADDVIGEGVSSKEVWR
jgi:hypothetical protein